MLNKFFTRSERGNLEISQQRSSTERELINFLRIKIEELIKKEEEMDTNSSALLSKLDSIRGFVHTEEISTYSAWNFGEDSEGKCSRLLSKKLKMIKSYYLQEGVFDSGRVKFGWLRTGNYDQSDDQSNVRDSEFEVKNMAEMRENIGRLMFERRKEMEIARAQGKKSLMEWIVAGADVGVLKSKARKMGISLSRHISDFFYLVVENGEAFHKFCNHLKCLLKWIVDKEKTAVIRRIVSVIEVAERDLSVKRKIRIYEMRSATSKSPKQLERMDRVLEAFLREVLYLESILSYPNLSTDGEMKTLKSALEACEKEMDKIGLEITSLKKTHNFIFEGQNEDLEMESFEATVEWTVSEVWQQLEEEYAPNWHISQQPRRIR